ncbi:MAG: hypothetical protein NZ519_00275 [Bacteroidia bacterium]|nr:hypothetical protein [Bacteroidia bacterium]MDW8300840.1 hypothetical protein [Bacteroidia bacterium]
MLDVMVTGVNAPKEHQRVIRKLIARSDWLYRQGKIPFEPLSEMMVDETKVKPYS